MKITEFINLLCLLLLNSCVIAGLFISSRYDLKRAITFSVNPIPENIDNDSKMILWQLSFYSEKWFGYFWSKPIINCMPCMASIHSTYVYWYFQQPTVNNLIMYAFYIPILAFINFQLSKIC